MRKDYVNGESFERASFVLYTTAPLLDSHQKSTNNTHTQNKGKRRNNKIRKAQYITTNRQTKKPSITQKRREK